MIERLLATIFATCLCVSVAASSALACETGQSCLPDNDATGLNNSFEAAEDLGVLGSDQTGQPRTVIRQGELGRADNGFDTVDFYKFRLPPNQFEVTISTTETPPTTSWIMIYDQNRRPLIDEGQGKGHDNERVTLNLSAGTYYVAVRTDPGVAANRHLTYTLTIAPVIRALPSQGSSDCRSAQGFQDIGNGTTLSGSLASFNLTSAYAVYITHGSSFVVAPVIYPRQYEVALIDRPSGDRIVVAQAQTNSIKYLALDPGLYCLEVRGAGFSSQPINYQFNIGAPNMGFPPATQKSNAPCVTFLNLGNLTRNGQYGQVRQPQASNPSTPCYFEGATQYVMREWTGPARTESWFRFDLNEARKLEFRMTNLYDPVRAEIQDQNGNLLAGSVAEGSPLLDQLPPQVLSRSLPAGRYYLRTTYVGNRAAGTNMQIWMVANSP